MALTVVDDVTGNNWEKLANGRAYKYIVVAVPAAARFSATSGGADPAAQKDLYSSRGEATVTAKVPDPASSTYKVPKVKDLHYRADSNGMLYVSWTQPDNARATVGYFPGGYPVKEGAVLSPEAFDATFSGYTSSNYLFSSTGAGYLYPKNAVTSVFPIIGGKATIAVQTSYWSGGNLYARDNPEKIDITLDQYNLELNWTGTDFTATHIYQDEKKGTVQLSWPRILGDDDVYSSTTYSTTASNKVTYNVFKREIPVNDDISGILTATGDWVKVNFDFKNPGDGDASNTIYAVEKGDVDSTLSGWYYIVYASASRSGKTNHSYPLSAYLARTLPAEPTISASVAHNGVVQSDGYPYTNEIRITGGLANGVTYTLYRGELTPILIGANGRWLAPSSSGGFDSFGDEHPIENANYQFAVYDPEPVETWTGQRVLGDSNAIIQDIAPKIVARKTYIYKLVSSVGDTLLGDGSTSTIYPESTREAASAYSFLTLGVSPLPRDPSSGVQTNDADRGWIRATLQNSGYTKGMDAKLFYRTPGVTTTKWTELTSFTRNAQGGGAVSQITDENGEFKALDFPLPDAVYGEAYEFRAIAYDSAGKEMPNLDRADYTIQTGSSPDTFSYATIVEATASSELSKAGGISGTINWGTPPLSLSSATAQSILGITGDFLDGASVDIRVARSIVRTGKTTYFYQGSFSIAQTGATNSYQITTLVLANETVPPNDNVPSGTDNYVVQWKYPWEKWEDENHAWWIANRVITSINNY
jgi:hypothetical protein